MTKSFPTVLLSFGKVGRGRTQQPTPTIRYQYNSKEKIDELGLGWNDYGARNYDALLGRWMGVDALAEGQMSFNPYHYVYDNPMLLNDPDGRWPDNPFIAANAYFSGIKNSMTANMTVDFPGIRKSSDELDNEFGTYSNYAKYGQKAGNILSIGIGTAQAGLGGLATSAEIAALPATGGASALAIPETAAFTIHGASTVFTAAQHLGNPNKVDANKTSDSSTPSTTKPIHANSKSSPKPTWGYKLQDSNGLFLKNGITSNLKPETRYTKAFMKDKEMPGSILFPNRQAAYDWEYLQNTINRGPLNKNMH